MDDQIESSSEERNFMKSRFSIIKNIKVGKGTKIYDQVNLYECEIGENCKIDAFVYIESGVKIGNNVKIRAFTFIPTGVEIEDNVFIGPHVTFTNDRYPRVKGKWKLLKTIVREGASIGAGSIIGPGVIIGKYSIVGAGSVVIKDVPDFAIVVGNPARIIGSVTDEKFKKKVRDFLNSKDGILLGVDNSDWPWP